MTIVTLFITLITKSHDPLSSGLLWSDLSGSPHKLHPLSPEMGLGYGEAKPYTPKSERT